MLPPTAKFLSVQVQHGKPCMWVELDPDDLKSEQHFILCGTGFKIEDDLRYLGTIQMQHGDLVLHLFWRQK